MDPFVKSHELDENSNPHMNAATRAWAKVASEAGCAVVLVHHTRKGAAGKAGDVESSRGGKALADASRVVLTFAAMASDEATQCDVPLGERWRYVRLDDAKQSMATRADRVRWLRVVGVVLGNASAMYPNGDSVQATVRRRTAEAPGRGLICAWHVEEAGDTAFSQGDLARRGGGQECDRPQCRRGVLDCGRAPGRKPRHRLVHAAERPRPRGEALRAGRAATFAASRDGGARQVRVPGAAGQTLAGHFVHKLKPGHAIFEDPSFEVVSIRTVA